MRLQLPWKMPNANACSLVGAGAGGRVRLLLGPSFGIGGLLLSFEFRLAWWLWGQCGTKEIEDLVPAPIRELLVRVHVAELEGFVPSWYRLHELRRRRVGFWNLVVHSPEARPDQSPARETWHEHR